MSRIFSSDTVKKLRNESTSSGKDGRKCRRQSSDDEDESASKKRSGAKSSTSDGAISSVMAQSKWQIKMDESRANQADFRKICSICLRDSPESGNSLLLTPCLCTGNRSHQHKSCIEDWIEQTGTVSCPFCHVRYDFLRSKKGFLSYIMESDLQSDFLVNLAASLYSLYLFLVGSSICYTFLFSVYGCESKFVQQVSENLEQFNSIRWEAWSDLDKVLNCRRSMEAFHKLHSWPSIILFCLTCVATILLLVGIVSLCLNMTFRHYIKYLLWSRTNYKVDIKPYSHNNETTSSDT